MRKSNKTSIRNIQKTRSSYYITIPINIIRKLGWREKQKVVVNLEKGRKIEIKDWKK